MVDLLSYQVKESLMYGYIYKTTFVNESKIYIGLKKSLKFNESYYGSGVIISKLINKYGRQNFTLELIDIALSKEELDLKEVYWINYYNSTNPDIGYNIALGGSGVHVEHLTLQTKDKISKANSGKIRTDDVRSLMSLDRKGSIWINDGLLNKLIRRWDIDNYIYPGSLWNQGMVPGTRKVHNLSKTHKLHIGLAHQGKVHSLEWTSRNIQSHKEKRYHWYTNGIKNMYISEFDTIPEGFKRGKTVSDEFKKVLWR